MNHIKVATRGFLVSLTSFLFLWSASATNSYSQNPSKQMELERERAYNKQQFQKYFRDLQLISQGLLREHESFKLTPKRLGKDSKAINKCAKNLRVMMALGKLALPTQVNTEIDGPRQFDDSIRKLSKLVWDFAHNPVHQNSKVFNTDQAALAQTHLLAIINLSKALETRAKIYSIDSLAQ